MPWWCQEWKTKLTAYKKWQKYIFYQHLKKRQYQEFESGGSSRTIVINSVKQHKLTMRRVITIFCAAKFVTHTERYKTTGKFYRRLCRMVRCCNNSGLSRSIKINIENIIWEFWFKMNVWKNCLLAFCFYKIVIFAYYKWKILLINNYLSIYRNCIQGQ